VNVILAIVAGLVFSYVLLVLALLAARPSQVTLTEILRLLPDLVRLIRRLAADVTVPRGVRIRLWLLLAYLAMPFDLIPDVVPVLGYADDAILVALVLRSVVRRAGPESLARQWPGTADGLSAVARLAGVPPRS
jgi:uncharacterized membrane protein YkvA (DUF1232 family)